MSVLDDVIAKMNAKYKKNIVQVGVSTIYVEKIPFSSPKVNYMTYGGIPIGKGTEFLGPEGGGKTTSALDITGQAQKKAQRDFDRMIGALRSELVTLEEKNNKSDQKKIETLKKDIKTLNEKGPRRCVYIDLENTLDEKWAEKIGVDLNSLLLMRPDDETAEEVLQMVLDMIDSGEIELLVIDSLPMLVSKRVFEESLDKKQYGGIAGVVTDFVGKVSPILNRAHTAFIIINQIRQNFDNPHDQFNTPGGQALRHFFSLRMFFRKGTFLNKDNEEVPLRTANPSGNIVDVTIVKTKICKPDRRIGQYTINYERAIDVLADTVFMAINYGFIMKSGTWYYLMDTSTGEILSDNDGEVKFHGEAKLLEYLRNDEEIFDEIYDAVQTKLAEVS
jgi:recombination protein RecA